MSEPMTVQRFTGADVERYIDDVARLRIEVFREYPYLYDGDMAYEANYLRTYIESPDSVVVIAFDGARVIGASTAVPLRHETDEIKAPFIHSDIDPDSVFYLGESVLRKSFRGRGFGVRFFEERETHARTIGTFKWCAFCAVQRPIGHPRRPMDYVPLNDFWNKRGYFKRRDLHTTLTWREVDETEPSPKPMTFWLKRFDGAESNK
jgi:GNAT superfamily N-acetyltransferase